MDTLSTTIDTHVGAGARASSTSEPQKHQSDFDSDYTTLNTHAPQFQGLAFTSQPEARLASGSTTPNQTTSRSGAVDVPRAQTKPQSDLNSAAGSYPSPDLLSASWGSATSASSKTPTRPSNVVAEGASSWTDPNASPRLRPKGSWTHIFSRPALPSSSPSNAGTVNLSASCLAPTTAGGLSSARASVESLGASQAAEATSSRKAPRHSSSFTRTVKDIVSGRRGSLPYTGHSQQQDASHAPLSGASTPIVTIDDVDFDHDDDHAQLSRSARQAQNISLGMHEGDGGQPSSSQPRGGTHSDMLQVDSAEPALQASDAPSYSMDDSRSDATATGALSGQEGTEPVETLNDSAAAPDVGPEKSKSAGPQSGRPPLVTPEGGTSTSSSLLRRFSGGMLSEEALRPSSYSLLGGPRSANPSGGISGALMQMSSSLGAPGGGGAAAIQYPRTAGPSTGATSFNNVMAQYDVPRSSILLNPGQRKTVVDDWRWESVGASPPANDETRPPLTIRRVPVVASARERREAAREAARAREIAREKERERLREKEREAEEKVWGIPKKAFYMGLPDLSFNAQASMLAGWGNGSGTTDFRPISRINRSRPNSAHGRSGSYSSITSDAARRESLQKDRERDRRERELERLRIEEEQDAAEEEPMDPEELAALNAIINTRRSAEAAMALASGQLRFGLPLRARAQSTHSTDSAVLRDSRDASATMDVADQSSPKRPSIAGGRTDSRDSVPSLASTQVEDVSSVFQHRPSLSKRRSTSQSSKGLGPPKIRFAPLPHPFGMLPPSLEEDVENGGGRRGSKDSSSGKKHAADGERVLQNLAANGTLPKIDGMSSAAEDSDSISDSDEEGWARRWSTLGERSKVYLMSMLSSEKEEARSRRRSRRRGRASSRASSVKSRNSSVGSGDEDDRLRRREMIRASRPGGTGMVTLPDGTKIKARRVGERSGDAETDYEEVLEPHEWGFAGLAKEYRRSLAAPSVESVDDAATGDKRASAADGPVDLDDSEAALPVADADLAASEADADATGEGYSSDRSWPKRRRRSPSPIAAEDDADARTPTAGRALAAQQAEGERDAAEDSMAASHDTLSPEGKLRSPRPGTHQPGQDSVSTAASKPRNATLPMLNAQQAAEVRRRHEEEVAALGAEVLANIARNKDKSKGVTSPALDDTRLSSHLANAQSPLSPNFSALTANANAEKRPDSPPGSTNQQSAKMTQSKDDDARREKVPSDKRPHEPKRRPTLPLPLANILRKSQREPSQTRRQASSSSATSKPSEDAASSAAELDKPTAQKPAEGLAMAHLAPPASPGRSNNLSPASNPTRTLSPSSSLRDLSPAASPRVSRAPSFGHSPTRPRFNSPSDSHLAGISMPAPSPSLPRRPDARGYSVVPLPSNQLGARPSRPREGRVWQYDDSDGFSSSSSASEPESRAHEAGKGKSQEKDAQSDSDSDAMDPEELAEEERLTAIQKKRATTRAAGQEVMSAKVKSSSSTRGISANTRNGSGTTGSSRTAHGSHDTTSPGLRATTSSANVPRNARKSGRISGKGLRGTASLGALPSRRGDASDDFNDTDEDIDELDDSELWSSTISQAMTGLRRPSKGVIEAELAKAKLAREKRLRREEKERRVRLQKEKERKEKEELDPDWGWVSKRGGGPIGMGASTTSVNRVRR